MSDSKIEWTQKTWNPVVGCSKVSPGCDHCYAERMAARQVHMGTAHYADTVKDGKWTGKIGIAPDSIFLKPLHWRKPSKIFVCSMGDLFHESVPFETIDRIFAVMALCPQHTFQILTKRPERMAEYLTVHSNKALSECPEARIGHEAMRIAREELGEDIGEASWDYFWSWPLSNTWLGTTVESPDQRNRIGYLLGTPAVVRFISIEPMLAAMDLSRFLKWPICKHWDIKDGDPNVYGKYRWAKQGLASVDWKGLDWIICGGESGPGARPMHPDWARDLRDQCKAADVPFLFKQWGEWMPKPMQDWTENQQTYLEDGKGGGVPMYRHGYLGKKFGLDYHRQLDGVTHDEYPVVNPSQLPVASRQLQRPKGANHEN